MSNKNVELIQNAYANFLQGNIPKILDILSDEVEWFLQGTKEIPFAGTFKGKNGVLNFFQKIGATTEFNSFNPNEFFSNENKVVVLGESEAITKSTNKKTNTRWVHEWTLSNGKVTNYYNYLDTAEIADSFRN